MQRSVSVVCERRRDDSKKQQERICSIELGMLCKKNRNEIKNRAVCACVRACDEKVGVTSYLTTP